jgi:nucleoside-triphosphatase THEP1
LATIALKGGRFINEAKKTAGVELITITDHNRDVVVEQIMKKLLK